MVLGNEFVDLQNRLFTIFTFIFVAPGVIAQTQPKFIANRDVVFYFLIARVSVELTILRALQFEAREKKAMIYSWKAFIFGEIVRIGHLLTSALS